MVRKDKVGYSKLCMGVLPFIGTCIGAPAPQGADPEVPVLTGNQNPTLPKHGGDTTQNQQGPATINGHPDFSRAAICSWKMKGPYATDKKRKRSPAGETLPKRDIDAPPVGQGDDAWTQFFKTSRQNHTATRPTYSLDTHDDGSRPVAGSTAFLYETSTGAGPFGTNASTFNIFSEQLYGCTALYVANPAAAYMAHFWEDLAFSSNGDPKYPGDADFDQQVTQLLEKGGADKAAQAPLAARNDLFDAHDPSATQAYIFTPAVDANDDGSGGMGWTDEDKGKTPLYADQIKKLQGQVKRLTGAEPKVLAYEKPPRDPSMGDDSSPSSGLESESYRALLQVDTEQEGVKGEEGKNGLLRAWFYKEQLQDVWFKSAKSSEDKAGTKKDG